MSRRTFFDDLYRPRSASYRQSVAFRRALIERMAAEARENLGDEKMEKLERSERASVWLRERIDSKRAEEDDRRSRIFGKDRRTR